MGGISITSDHQECLRDICKAVVVHVWVRPAYYTAPALSLLCLGHPIMWLLVQAVKEEAIQLEEGPWSRLGSSRNLLVPPGPSVYVLTMECGSCPQLTVLPRGWDNSVANFPLSTRLDLKIAMEIHFWVCLGECF